MKLAIIVSALGGAACFAPHGFRRSFAPRPAPLHHSSGAAAALESPPPSWDELAELAGPAERRPAKLTFYRDTNGWCPFCERVWVALELKGLAYEEVLINLYDKPQWYKDLVPSALVPAIEIHDEAFLEQEKKPGSSARGLVPESADIMKLLDSEFPVAGGARLYPAAAGEKSAEFDKAMEVAELMTDKGFAYSFGARNKSVTEEGRLERKVAFERALDEAETHLAAHGGPFLAGPEITAADLVAIPMMERYRYQLPLMAGSASPALHGPEAMAQGRPKLSGWFDALDASPGYAARARGDAYSWTAVTSTFLRVFSSAEPEQLAAADAAAEEVLLQAASPEAAAEAVAAGSSAGAAAVEAARKLISNHEAVVADACRADPKSQLQLARITAASHPAPAASEGGASEGGASEGGASEEGLRAEVDAMLREAAAGLLAHAKAEAQAEVQGGQAQNAQGALQPPRPAKSPVARAAARLVASRLCAPRDMGAPAAAVLRARLMAMAASP